MGFLDLAGLTRFKGKIDDLLSGKLSTSLKGAPNGLAELDSNGKVLASQLPSYVDDVLEFASVSNFPAEGDSGIIYVDTATNISYRWSGSTYVRVASDLALGETSSTAYRGDYGAAAYAHGVTNKGSAYENGMYKITTNAEGHVTNATAVQQNDLTSLGMATRDSNATEGNFAAFDSTGNPVDSGHAHSDYVLSSSKGTANGVASLDSSGKVPSTQLLSDIETYASMSNFPVSGSEDKLYIDKSADVIYRWDSTNSSYVSVGGGNQAGISEYSETITTSDWSSDVAGYAYTWTNSNVKTSSFFDVFYDEGARSAGAYDISTSKVTGGIKFTTTTLPTGTIPVTIRLYDVEFVTNELPNVTSSNNGEILSVVNGQWAAATAPSGLPTVTSSDNGKSLEVVNGEWEVGNEKINKKYKESFGNAWSEKMWSGSEIPSSFYTGSCIWSDGNNIYFSAVNQYTSPPTALNYVLNKLTNTWEEKNWNGLTYINASYVWTDGDNIYYSAGTNQYILDKSTSTWSTKTWTGLTSFRGDYIWTDGDNIYYNDYSDQYILDKSTSTWNVKTWIGTTDISPFEGNCIWTDGDNIYYSYYTDQYVLDKSTSTWSQKTWNVPSNYLDVNGIWTDGDNIYYSNNSDQYVLDKSTSTWSTKTWAGLTEFYGSDIWTDGDNIYYSNKSEQYVIHKDTSQKLLLGSNGEFNPTPAEGIILPSVSSTDNGKVLSVVSGDWAAAMPGPSVQYTLTALSSGWSNSTQTITAPGVTSSNYIMVGVGECTDAQYEAISSAQIRCIAQGTNSITLKCAGTVPSIDVPINVCILQDSSVVESQAVVDIENKIGTVPSGQTLQGQISNNAQSISTMESEIGTVPSGSTLQGQVSDNSEAIAKLQNGLAYIVGNTNTTGSTLSVGQFVYVKGHSTIAEGLRKVTADISANGSITTSNTSTCPEGGFNALNGRLQNEVITVTKSNFITSGIVSCIVKSGWAFVSLYEFTFGGNGTESNAITGLPKAKCAAYGVFRGETAADTALLLANGNNYWIDANATRVGIQIGGNPTKKHYAAFAYPVADE